MALHPRHRRFFAAVVVGVLAGLAVWLLPTAMTLSTRVLIPADLFLLAYLGMSLRFAKKAGPAVLKDDAATEDEGIALILCLATAALGISLWGIVLVLHAEADSVGVLDRVLALAAVPLAWGMIHMVAAFRYAHLHYSTPGGAIALPEGGQPGAMEFVYFAYVIGMCAQVSDIVVTSSNLRRTVTLHAIASFFANTVILALAVNAAVSLGG
jgi:uncharacterized membrane protein